MKSKLILLSIALSLSSTNCSSMRSETPACYESPMDLQECVAEKQAYYRLRHERALRTQAILMGIGQGAQAAQKSMENWPQPPPFQPVRNCWQDMAGIHCM